MHSLRPTSVAEHEALKVHRTLRTYKDPTPPLETLPPTFRLKIYLKDGKEIGNAKDRRRAHDAHDPAQ